MIYTLNITDVSLADELQKLLVWSIDLYDREMILDINYKVHGRYYPATYFEPEEFPEIEIKYFDEIEIGLDSGNYILHEKQIKKITDILLEKLPDALETACLEDYSERDYDYD